jgi:hypothetical protein
VRCRIILKGTEIEEIECDGVDWLIFVQDTGQWRVYFSKAKLNLRLPYRAITAKLLYEVSL